MASVDLVVLQQHRFGDLQLQPARRQAGGRKRGEHGLDQMPVLELVGREVDGNLDVLGPRGGRGAGLPHRPFAERHDEPGLLGQRE